MRINETKLKSLAQVRGLGVKELLELAGVSATAYYSLTRKDSLFPKSIHKLADFLKVEPSELLVDEFRLVQDRLALEEIANKIIAEHPNAFRDDVVHTLVLLQKNPLERLNLSLRRGATLRGR